MSFDPRLTDLLLTWEDALARGEKVSAAELCRDCPDLILPLEARIRALCALTPVLNLAPFEDDATDPQAATAPLPDIGSIPGFVLQDELGRGGSGVVYKANQTALDRLVAIKILMGGAFAGEVALQRFQSEARTLAQLRDAHIVQIHDIGTVQGLRYFVLEYVDGGSLARLCDGKPLDPRETAELLAVLARTAHHVHRAGIVHRDLKPANVLLRRLDPQDKDSPAAAVQLRGQWFFPKLSDFGLARAVDDISRLTGSGMVVGTPAYMSPEQTQGSSSSSKGQVGPASDIYSLGVILYQLLTGALPFEADATWQVMHQITMQDPQSPRQRRPDCPAELETICLRCLEKDPADRYASAEALEEDLQRYLRGEPVSSSSRRRRLPSLGAWAALACLLAGVLCFFLAFGRRTPEGPPDKTPLAQTDKGPIAPVTVIKIGVLISTRGPRARIDQAILDGARLAVEELNAKGDKLQIVSEGDWVTAADFQALVTSYLTEVKVSVLIGCAAPEDRKSIGPLLEQYRQLLLVPARSETIAPGSRVVCLEPPLGDITGYVARWIAAEKSKSKVLWVDDETPVAKAMTESLASAFADLPGGATFADRHIGPKGFDWDALETDFAAPAVHPNAILAYLHGDDLYHVFATFKAPRPAPEMVFFDLTEEDKAQFVDVRELKDLYVLSTWSGPERTKDSPLSKRLAANPELLRRASCNTASAYAAVHLWRQASKAANSLEPDRVRQALANQRFDGLGEPVTINGPSGHATRVISLGQMDAMGKIQRWQ
jgi:serine/threonine protein kinase